ncbi:MAG: hypothetical protein ACRC14_02785 [Paracoccaceae bacterium]
MSGETVVYMGVLVLLVGGTAAYFCLRLLNETRSLWRALIALRDKIDGAKRWP